MRKKARLVGVALCSMLFAWSPGAGGIETGQIAPPFELQLIGDGSLSSGELFPAHGYTFLVFWGSSCPHCVDALRSCEEFHRRYGSEEVAVVGINTDEDNLLSGQGLLAIRGILESSGVSFPQLRDAGRSVAGSYAVPYGTFAVYLVARSGVVLAASVDPEGDIESVMENMLTGGRDSAQALGEAAPPGAGVETSATVVEGVAASAATGFSFSGKERMRFLSIDSRGSGAVGPYGESISPGNRFQYRLEVEMTRQVLKHLRLGGLLRIGNEGKRVLESGPQYLGSEWGSAFAEMGVSGGRVRLGYYTLFMTPLTLMRWDWDDNPRSGGDGGCGCGATAGILLVESLDELGPELTFEGGIATYSVSDFEARVFYAMPWRAKETSYMNYRAGVGDRARYALEIYGCEGKWRRFDSRSGGFWEAAVHAIGSKEDRRTVDFLALGYPAADPWATSWTVTASGEIPIIRHVRLRGEIVAWNKNVEHGIATLEGSDDISREGSGGIGGIVFEASPDLSVKLDYLRLDEDFFTPFPALSYEPNTEGLRGSAQVPIPRAIGSLSLFYKRLDEVHQPLAGMERKQIEFSGAAVDFNIANDLGAGAGWLEKRSWRHGDRSTFDAYRRALTASVHYDFGKVGVIELQYQKITNRDTRYDYLPALSTESRSDLYSVRTTINF